MVVILGADQPFAGTEPSALIQTSGDRRALDWILEAFENALPDPEIHFVGGYRLEDVVTTYPDVHFSHNEEWDTSGPVASLFEAPLPDDRPIYVCYADTVFEANAVESLNGGDATIAVDREWRTRYVNRDEASLDRAEKIVLDGSQLGDAGSDVSTADADAEFTGLLRLSPTAIDRARRLYESRTVGDDATIPDLLRALQATGLSVQTIDISGKWAELETAADLARFVLDTKANTLRRLKSMVSESQILDQYTFTVETYTNDADSIHDAIADRYDSVIVRSSALAEDTWDESNAGAFDSILNVAADDQDALATAIEKVIDSYPDENPANQVLVQPMITNVAGSGVVMTRSVDGGSPYYVINYDATTASTESVTDGTGEHLRTAIVRKDLLTNGVELSTESTSAQFPDTLDFEPLLRAVCELEELIGHDSLDIEFAIDSIGDVYILQTRPMTLDPANHGVADKKLFETVDVAKQQFTESQTPSPVLHGDRTFYGVMPDWNPAEIIGRKPRRLASSLYRYLVMNEIWARQRAEYGYRDVRPHPLLKSFAGQPYVDVRADFNSFIPASVPDDLAERLVDYYLSRLAANPELHDKVEFDIILTCLTFDFETEIEPLLEAGFTRDELEPLRQGLKEITHNAYERIETDMAKIDKLANRYNNTLAADLPPLVAAQQLLEDCRRLGTLPFAHLARTAFVATALLRSLERKSVLTAEQVAAFQNSLSTVAREFEQDGYRVATGDLAWEEFVDHYGHLRPGTYEITSPAYAVNPDEYLQPIVDSATEPEALEDSMAVWDDGTKAQVEAELEGISLPADADRFINFLVDAIEGREHSKFVFSRNLSEALERIAAFGEQRGFSREELSYVPIERFFEITLDHPPADINSWLADRIREGRESHAITQAVELPPLLFDESDFHMFERPTREPNFVTDGVVTASVIELDEDDLDLGQIDGKLVMLQAADPGYDWIFGHDIAGLITMYGGANSHMAVRAAEFGLPAAIGVGENRYGTLRGSELVELDCSARTIRKIE